MSEKLHQYSLFDFLVERVKYLDFLKDNEMLSELDELEHEFIKEHYGIVSEKVFISF